MNTNSWSFPNMINVTQNKVSLVDDYNSIKNRISLLLRTEPTEVYGDPEYGVGLKRFMWQYNNSNTAAIVKQRIVDQITRYEPQVDPQSITFVDHDESNGVRSVRQDANTLHLTVLMKTVFGDEIEVEV